MNRLDRVMGILLLLRGGRPVSAAEMSRRFEVSSRTIYRDIEVLSGLGIPVSAEMGRTGGFRLLEGYFLPPVALGPEEAVSLLLGLALTRALRVSPFPDEADFAERKLLAILPLETRKAIERVRRAIGFERAPADLLHPERDDPIAGGSQTEKSPRAEADEARTVGQFLRALLAGSRVRIKYGSPYREEEPEREVEPRGIVWDRDRWYLAGDVEGGAPGPRLFRSDRVRGISPAGAMRPARGEPDVSGLLGRVWLRKAMERWRKDRPVRVAMGQVQAGRMRGDWYYGNAAFEDLPDGRVCMVFGDDDPVAVAALVRWLGPGAELLEPREWRPAIASGLREMLAAHE